MLIIGASVIAPGVVATGRLDTTGSASPVTGGSAVIVALLEKRILPELPLALKMMLRPLAFKTLLPPEAEIESLGNAEEAV